MNNTPFESFFIDWFQIFCKPTEEIFTDPTTVARACNDVFGEPDGRLYTGLLEGVRAYINNFGLVITISGSFSNSTTNYQDDLREINNFLIPILKHLELYFTFTISLSRLDIAKNYNQPVDAFTYHGKKNASHTKYYHNSIHTGDLYGQRSKDTVVLRIYDKSIDPNRIYSFLRFGSIQYTRAEYEIGHNILKQLNQLNPFNLNIPAILKYCLSTKPYSIDNSPIEPKTYDKIKIETKNWKYAFETCKTIIHDHLEYNQIKELAEFINELLINEKIPPFT